MKRKKPPEKKKPAEIFYSHHWPEIKGQVPAATDQNKIRQLLSKIAATSLQEEEAAHVKSLLTDYFSWLSGPHFVNLIRVACQRI